MSQAASVERWVREILALPVTAKVEVHERERGCDVVVTNGEQRATHVLRGALRELNWGSVAQDLLKLGPSCAESSS